MSKLKNIYKGLYETHASFVLRTPLFPIKRFFDWKVDPAVSAARQKESLREHIRSFYAQPIVQEALYIGSPDLHAQLPLWLDNKIEKEDKKEKLEISLAKYMIRMCTRCTPYGLFASCTSGRIGEQTEIQLTDKALLERHVRLDMDYVCQALSHILKQEEIAAQLRFYPNTSLYRFGNELRYIEHRFTEQSGRSYHLVQIEQSSYLDEILQSAQEGRTPGELAAALTDDDILPDEAAEFVSELITNQVLVSELEPNVTGEEYFHSLLHRLKELNHTEKYVRTFELVLEEIKGIVGRNADAKTSLYAALADHLRQLEIPVHLKTLVQVDTYRPTLTCTLRQQVQEDITRGLSLVQFVSSDTVRDTFAEFKQNFMNRYESQWMSLTEVLDTESGIGYGKFATTGMEESPLIDKLPIGNGVPAPAEQFSDAESFKWQLYQEAIGHNKFEVVIPDKTIEEFSQKEFTAERLPDSMQYMFRIHARSAADVDSGHYLLSLQAPYGPSGGNLLGRFCHLHPEIEDLTRTILQTEEQHQPDAVFAEIVHLPESRIGNILMRPILREYEIPYLCGTILGKEFQIPVNDLVVGVVNGKVTLRSKRLNKEVIPRMTTAHNFSTTTLPIYQFLCDLQFQRVRNQGWSWGILENRPFLPRVSYGKFILARARWLLTKEDVRECEKKHDDELLTQFSDVVRQKNLPDYLLLSQGDNELLLHLKNIYCIRLLLSELQKSNAVILTESLDTPDTCWIKSPEGSHCGEFIMAMSRTKKQPVNTDAGPPSAEPRAIVQRYFPVGSEWLYAKIYCGTKTAESVLTETLKPFTEELLQEGLIDKFFFLRYGDTSYHIRIRFHSAVPGFWRDVVQRLQNVLQPYSERNLVHNVQFETYQREVERYGAETTELSEDIFFYQSQAVMSFISMLHGDEGEQYRWKVGLKAVDLFLDDFGYKVDQKRDLVKVLNEQFATEFHVGPAEQKKISERFNDKKKLVQQLMSEEWDDENLTAAVAHFRIDDPAYRAVVAQVLSITKASEGLSTLNALMGSYLHMLIIRIFISNNRKTELVIYDHLLKYYESKIARDKVKEAVSVTVAEV